MCMIKWQTLLNSRKSLKALINQCYQPGPIVKSKVSFQLLHEVSAGSSQSSVMSPNLTTFIAWMAKSKRILPFSKNPTQSMRCHGSVVATSRRLKNHFSYLTKKKIQTFLVILVSGVLAIGPYYGSKMITPSRVKKRLGRRQKALEVAQKTIGAQLVVHLHKVRTNSAIVTTLSVRRNCLSNRMGARLKSNFLA